MHIFTIVPENREAIEMSCEAPGGYSRPFLKALMELADARLQFRTILVTSDRPDWLEQHAIERRNREDRHFRQIIAECRILLEGTPAEFEESGIELSFLLEQDTGCIESEALRRARNA